MVGMYMPCIVKALPIKLMGSLKTIEKTTDYTRRLYVNRDMPSSTSKWLVIDIFADIWGMTTSPMTACKMNAFPFTSWNMWTKGMCISFGRVLWTIRSLECIQHCIYD